MPFKTAEQRLKWQRERRAQMTPAELEARREYYRAYRDANRDRLRNYYRQWTSENRERVNERNRLRYGDPEVRAQKLAYDKTRTVPESQRLRHLETAKEWKANNPERVRLHKAKHLLALGAGISASEIPQDAAEAKALQLAIQREIKRARAK